MSQALVLLFVFRCVALLYALFFIQQPTCTPPRRGYQQQSLLSALTKKFYHW